ncbi:major facilitator superfamily domain-containing protein [Aspergillus pseudoustus]|uniref:Major facilitator superfamily domain-containing protein n=1 Tax=Aspergillus pseudoustus TaxID=1810923 RepID=A0ABR4IK77_9EURO
MTAPSISEVPEKGPRAQITSYISPSPSLSGSASTPASPIEPLSPADKWANVSPEFHKRAMRKVDFWLVGFYSLVYIFRVIDSSNYANAAIINLEEGNGIKAELGFTPGQWSWSQSIFSYSYMLFEPTNTILLKKFRPSLWMFLLIFFWGVSATCSGAVQNFEGMMCVRFAIGLAEAGFYPSVLYHMAFWYKPSEMPWRIALFYSVGQLSSAISGLLAYAISHMNRLGGLSGWRWLFILEGLPAILFAFVALFGIPDYPETAKMLTPEEREYLSNRLSKAAPSGRDHNWSWAAVKSLLKTPTVYTFSIYWIGHGIGGFGVNYALPTVIYELGFTTTANSQLMNIPPYVACFLFLNLIGHFLQKKWIRPWTTAVAIESTIIICYIILITVHNSVVKYLVLIVATACAGSAYPVIWPERIRALEGTVAAGVGIGLTNAMAQFSGVAGPHVYNSRFGPTYRTSYIICLCFLIVAITGVTLSWGLVWRNDRRVRREEKEKAEVSEPESEGVVAGEKV